MHICTNERTANQATAVRTNEQPSDFGVNDCAHGKDQDYVYDCDCDCDIFTYLYTYRATDVMITFYYIESLCFMHTLTLIHMVLWCYLRIQLIDVTSLSKHWHKYVRLCVCAHKCMHTLENTNDLNEIKNKRKQYFKMFMIFYTL